MKKILVLALVALSLSACASLTTPPVSGFGSNLPNGAVLHNGEIESYIGLGENDAALGYVVGNYRIGFDANAPREFKVEELGAVLNINDTVSALWSEVPTTVRVFRNGIVDTILMTGTEGRAPSIAARIVERLGTERFDLDNIVELSNVFVLTIIDTGDRVLIHRKRLAGTYASAVMVHDAEQTLTFLSTDLLPPPEKDIPNVARN